MNKLFTVIYRFYSNNFLNSHHAFLLPFLFKIESGLPIDPHPFIRFAFAILFLSVLALASFINIIGYFIALYLISNYDINTKYPRYVKIINYFEKSGKLIIGIEIVFCIFLLVFIIILSATACSVTLKFW